MPFAIDAGHEVERQKRAVRLRLKLNDPPGADRWNGTTEPPPTSEGNRRADRRIPTADAAVPSVKPPAAPRPRSAETGSAHEEEATPAQAG